VFPTDARAFAFGFAVVALACSSEESANAGGASGSGGAGGSGDASSGDAASDVSGDSSNAAPPYSIDALDSVRIGSDSSKPNFQRASAAIDLRDGPFESARLEVELETTCFPFESWSQNPPPAGHNWPADCDAFDRNFEVALDEPEDPATDPPGLELVRAITPFGGPMKLEADITDVANGLPGPHELSVLITTWSDSAGQVSGADGGWNVSARIHLVPGTPPRRVLAVLPLFYDSVGVADGEPISFSVPDSAAGTRVEYRATGHGGVGFGCGAATAEEFCRRTHTIFADGEIIADLTPYRDDCATLCTLDHYGAEAGGFDYCRENPCGAIDSVRAPRANWCPGSVTPPFTWELDSLASAGEHSFRWKISDVADGGSWRLSAAVFVFGE
jgi:hypothetical protein